MAFPWEKKKKKKTRNKPTICPGASLVAQLVKNSPAMRKTLVQVLGQEDPLKGKATRPSILAWRVPWGLKESDTTE